MPLHRTVTLLGFKKPVVKGESIHLDVIHGAGDTGTLIATPALWDQIAGAVLLAANPSASGLAFVGKGGVRKTPKCTGCDNPGCADCVAGSRPPILKPGTKRIL
ncbi:MAG: hypothetical protein WC661_21285 [Opitutaceae bacterium]|jgi:hypothetical protein